MWKYGYVPLEELFDWVRDHRLSDGRCVPVCMWGARGTAKTATVKHYAQSRGMGIRIFQPAHSDDGSDLIGIPHASADGKRVEYALPGSLPVEGECEPEGVLFIDEINRSKPGVLQGLMPLIGEGELTQCGWRLPDGWMIILAANPNIPGYDVTRLDDAMLGRMMNVPAPANLPNWSRWADQAQLDSRIVDFMLQNRDLVDLGESDLPGDVKPTMSLRTGEYLGRLYEPGMSLAMLDLIARGLCGDEVAEAMVHHHSDQERPLDPQESLSEGAVPVINHWLATERTDLVRASVERLVALLQGREPKPSKAVPATARFLDALPAGLLQDAVVSFQESAQGWLPLILTDPETMLINKLPRGGVVRRTRDRDIGAERDRRIEEATVFDNTHLAPPTS